MGLASEAIEGLWPVAHRWIDACSALVGIKNFHRVRLSQPHTASISIKEADMQSDLSSPPEELKQALQRMLRSPLRTLVPPWSWKAAAFTSVLRGIAFFATNLKSGGREATKALLVEALFAIFAGGLIGAISQYLRKARASVGHRSGGVGRFARDYAACPDWDSSSRTYATSLRRPCLLIPAFGSRCRIYLVCHAAWSIAGRCRRDDGGSRPQVPSSCFAGFPSCAAAIEPPSALEP